jgi:hypothetical protein
MMLSAPMIIGGAWLIWRGMREPLPQQPALTESPAPPGAAKANEPA